MKDIPNTLYVRTYVCFIPNKKNYKIKVASL